MKKQDYLGYDEKTGIQKYLQGFPSIYRDENTDNKCFCAEKCLASHEYEGEFVGLTGWQGRELINILLLYRKTAR